VSERKRWEAEKARQAPKEDDQMVEEVVEDAPLPDWTSSIPKPTHEMTEADLIAAQEEYELQQLIAAMEEQDQDNDAASQHFGSDDEDYDQLFMDCTTTGDEQHLGGGFTDSVAMDMDMTDG
jgi:cation diffusion facilitator CzcD-associated flavoprotein CzcO